MHSIKPPAHIDNIPANQYKNRTLGDALTFGSKYRNQLKHNPGMSEYAKKQFRRQCHNHIAPPYAKNIDFDHILMPEFHSWLNKSKRWDNRFLEIASKLDAGLKSKLAKTNITEFDQLTKAIYTESTLNSPDLEKLKTLKNELRSIAGPHELAYEKLLSKMGIARSTAHGGGFTGKYAWRLFQSPGLCEFMATKTWSLHNGQKIELGSNYAVLRFQQYMLNTVNELKLSSYPGTLYDHEKSSLEILIAENGRERCLLFPNHIPLRSDHSRAHLPDQLKLFGDLIPSERGTEKKNQHMLQIQRSFSSKMPNLEKRAQNEFFRAVI